METIREDLIMEKFTKGCASTGKHSRKNIIDLLLSGSCKKNGKSSARRSKGMMLLAIFILTVSVACVAGRVIVKGENQQVDGNYTKHYISVCVQPGDSLWSISREYSDSIHYNSINEHMNEVISTNHLTSDQLTVGQYLVVPCYILDEVTE